MSIDWCIFSPLLSHIGHSSHQKPCWNISPCCNQPSCDSWWHYKHPSSGGSKHTATEGFNLQIHQEIWAFSPRKSSVLGCFLVLLSSICVIHVRCGCSDPCHVSSSVAPTAAFSFQPLRSFTMDSAKYQQEILLVIIKWKKQKNIYQAPVEDKSSSCHEVSPW